MFKSFYEVYKDGKKYGLWSKSARVFLCYGTKKQMEEKKRIFDELDKKDGLKYRPDFDAE